MSVATQPTRIERNAADVCRAVLEDVADDVLAVGPSTAVIEGLLTVFDEREEPPSVDLLVSESIIKDFVTDFTDASSLADAVATGHLSIRTAENLIDGPLLLTSESVVSVVSANGRTAGLITDDDGFVENAWEQYADQWDEAESYRLRTPPLSRIRETMDEEFGPEMTADFERMRVALGEEYIKAHFDEVDVCLLAAAKNEALLYDISTWGEDIGVASRATFSRKKTQLEDAGLIVTTKVPIDVGRPRLRLLLGDDRLRGADDLLDTAVDVLTTDA